MKTTQEINEERHTKLPIEMEVATEIVLETLLYRPIDAFRRLASRSHALESLSHQPQEEIK